MYIACTCTTFFGPLSVEFILRQLEINGDACTEYKSILFLMIAECMDLFAKGYSPCHPAGVILALRW